MVVNSNIITIFVLSIRHNKYKSNEIMRATVSYSNPTKVQVFTTNELKGQGVKNMGLKSNGETIYLLTQKAYEKIQDQCEWIK